MYDFCSAFSLHSWLSVLQAFRGYALVVLISVVSFKQALSSPWQWIFQERWSLWRGEPLIRMWVSHDEVHLSCYAGSVKDQLENRKYSLTSLTFENGIGLSEIYSGHCVEVCTCREVWSHNRMVQIWLEKSDNSLASYLRYMHQFDEWPSLSIPQVSVLLCGVLIFPTRPSCAPLLNLAHWHHSWAVSLGVGL